MTNDIDYLAGRAYASGMEPVDYAVRHIALTLEVGATVALGRDENPKAFAIYGPDPTNETLACRIVGELLGAGWVPPSTPTAPDHPPVAS